MTTMTQRKLIEKLERTLNLFCNEVIPDNYMTLAHESASAAREYLAAPEQSEPYCVYCESDNEGIKSTYYDQACAGCVKRMAAPELTGLKVISSYTPDMDAVRRAEKEKADKFLAAPEQSEPVERTAWIIEVPSLGVWIGGVQRESGFVKDANTAIHFQNKECAQEGLNRLLDAHPKKGTVFGLDRSCYKVTEHIFLDGYSAPQPDTLGLVNQRLLKALRGLIAFAEAAETKMLVGHEGCMWPVEAARDAIAAAEKEMKS